MQQQQHPNSNLFHKIYNKIPCKSLASSAIATNGILYKITNPMFVLISVVVFYMLTCLIVLPFYLLTFLVEEYVIYMSIIVILYNVLKYVLRMIAFPGASSRVVVELQTEYAKYVSRCLEDGADCSMELAQRLLNYRQRCTHEANSIMDQWALVESYRKYVLSVVKNVLETLLDSGELVTELSSSSSEKNNDIGHLTGTSLREAAHSLLQLLDNILNSLDAIELFVVASFSDDSSRTKSDPNTTVSSNVNEEESMNTQRAMKNLLAVSKEMKDLVPSLMPHRLKKTSQQDDSQDFDLESLTRGDSDTNMSKIGAVKGVFTSIFQTINPPKYDSVFCLDMLRGCSLLRHPNSHQIWIPASSGSGMIDAVCFPSKSNQRKRLLTLSRDRAVLYCNPNAGLYECGIGLDFFPDNENTEETTGWVDFYTNKHDMDVIMFNYCGYGRSYRRHSPSIFRESSSLILVLLGSLISFKPTSNTLKEDAQTVAEYMLNKLRYKELIIHGESIGGMAAAHTARYLSKNSIFCEDNFSRKNSTTTSSVSLLVCDRTFCNLESVAQRLVGGWTGTAIRAIAPFWNMDVTSDFIQAKCSKVVATDPRDAIIADDASLKAGIAVAQELLITSIRDVGWLSEIPLDYRMAEWSGSTNAVIVAAPSWPTDNNIKSDQSYSFAFSVRRFGKFATALKKKNMFERGRISSVSGNMTMDHGGEGIEMTAYSEKSHPSSNGPFLSSNDKSFAEIRNSVSELWIVLCCCDGLCGSPLGSTVKRGHDSIIAWLCCAVVFGGQGVVRQATNSNQCSSSSSSSTSSSSFRVTERDYELYLETAYPESEELRFQPQSLPFTIKYLESFIANYYISGDDDGSNSTTNNSVAFILQDVKDDLIYILSTLKYIFDRTSSPSNLEIYQSDMNFLKNNVSGNGRLLALHCGHNNHYRSKEISELSSIINQVMGNNK